MKNNSINQVVILCGGRGSRLMPLTNKVPKPMIDINGKPFLLILIEYLKSLNLKNFLLLTGYKNKIISNYFGNGSKFNLNISYSTSTVSTNTAKRLYLSKNQLRDNFLLMYSDNFFNFHLDSLINLHNNQITSLITKKNPGNIYFDRKTQSFRYVSKRNKNNQYVELGCMIINKDFIFKFLNNKNISLSEILENISSSYPINTKEIINSYYSIGDKKRLKKTKELLQSKKIILIDRDGVINKKAKKGFYVSKWDQMNFIKDTIKSLISMSKKGYKFIIISNQAGLSRRMIKKNDYKKINLNLKKMFKNLKINLLNIYTCPHHWDDKCLCRKPNPGLFFKASKMYNFRLDKVIYIGDQQSDLEACYKAFVKPVFLANKNKYDKISNKFKPIMYSSKLSLLINKIDKFYASQ